MKTQRKHEGRTLADDRWASLRKQVFPFAMLLPFLILAIIFLVIPIIMMVRYSFTDMDYLLKPNPVGWANYKKIFAYPALGQVLKTTFIYVAVNVIFSVLGSIFIVIITTYYLDIVYKRKNLGLLFRIIWLVPDLTPTIVFMFIWRFVFGPADYGLVNKLLIGLGMEPVDFFTKNSMVLLLLATCLRSASGSIILFSSAVSQIPESVIQSAKVDGASNFYICRRIVLPYLAWPITQKTLWTILGSFCGYESIRLLTEGGPMGSTTTYAFYVYENAHKYQNYGYASALSVFMVAMSITLGMIMLKVFQVDKQMRKPRMDI